MVENRIWRWLHNYRSLPKDEDLYEYWDDAYDISSTDENEITFSGRFPKPDYFKD